MSSVKLPERDLRLVVNAVRLCASAGPDRVDLLELLSAVAALVRCDVAFWNWYSLTDGVDEHALVSAPLAHQVIRAPLGPWLEHLPEHPIMSGLHGPVTKVSDVLRGRDLERTWLYQDAWEPAGIRFEIGLELSHRPNDMNVVVLSRGPGRDFSERDKLVLRLVRPHVDNALAQVMHAGPRLTTRERQVLQLVEDGLSNGEIGRQLGISEATAAKHLEHVYARIGARSRTQAIAICRDALLRGRSTRPALAAEQRGN
ncbi:MAG: helix-turn-helix transcriptional regulator [Actinomycetota bacterium]